MPHTRTHASSATQPRYYAIRDGGIGNIYWVGQAQHCRDAFESLRDDIGDCSGAGLVAYQIPADLAVFLAPLSGTDPAAIAALDAYLAANRAALDVYMQD